MKTTKTKPLTVKEIIKKYNPTVKTENNCKRLVFNKIINFDEDNKEITILADCFKYKDGMKGATYHTFEIVSEDDIQERIADLEGNDMELIKYWIDNFGEVTKQMIDNIDSSREALIDLMFDQSYNNELGDYMRKELKLKGDKAVLFNCRGGGRIGKDKLKSNMNSDLLEVIKEYEQ